MNWEGLVRPVSGSVLGHAGRYAKKQSRQFGTSTSTFRTLKALAGLPKALRFPPQTSREQATKGPQKARHGTTFPNPTGPPPNQSKSCAHRTTDLPTDHHLEPLNPEPEMNPSYARVPEPQTQDSLSSRDPKIKPCRGQSITSEAQATPGGNWSQKRPRRPAHVYLQHAQRFGVLGF